VGVWWSGSWRVADEASFDVAAELEELGYSALWSSGGFQPGLSPHFERLLGATTRAMVCSGIVSIWSTAPHAMAQAVADLELRHPNRFVLGLGASHAAIVENYTRPYSRTDDYLDALDAAGPSGRAKITELWLAGRGIPRHKRASYQAVVEELWAGEPPQVTEQALRMAADGLSREALFLDALIELLSRRHH